MNIRKRLHNAFRSGGLKEVVRKGTYHAVYQINNYMTERKVVRGHIEYGLNSTQRDEKIIVSLTSFPARFHTLPTCLKSLVMQNVKPDRIIVWLGSDTQEDQITDEMHQMEKYGVEYKIDTEKNLMAHKKYYYAMQEFPDDIIITADDDLIYPSDWVESLYRSYKKHPSCISARRVHMMRLDENGNLLPYNQWIDQCRSIKIPSMCLLGTGGSGKLYPPHLLHPVLLNYSVFMDLCSAADDIWLKCVEVYSKVKVVWVPNYEVDLCSIKASQEQKLSAKNVFENHNDVQLKKTMEYFDLRAKDFLNNE